MQKNYINIYLLMKCKDAVQGESVS